MLVKWEDVAPAVFCNPTDKAVFVVYDLMKQQFALFMDTAERADKELSLQLPKKFIGDQVHTWMFYINAAGDKVSTTIYLRETIVI